MAIKISTIFVLLFSLILLFTSTNGHNITQILSKHPHFSAFNHNLTISGLAEQISRRKIVTVLVADNPTMSRFLAKSPPPATIRQVLSLHILLDNYPPWKLRHLPGPTIQVKTFPGATNQAVYNRRYYINITRSQGGKVIRFSGSPGTLVAYFVRSIKEVFNSISVIQIPEILAPPNPSSLLTKAMSSLNCKLFSEKLSGTKAEEIYIEKIEKGLTIFCPIDRAFQKFMPQFQKLSEKKKNALLLSHGIPFYQSILMFKKRNRWFETLATDEPHSFRVRVNNGKWDEVNLKTEIVTTGIAGILIDDLPLAVYAVDGVLFPRELFIS